MSDSSSSWSFTGFCNAPICEGAGCSYLTNWHIDGLTYENLPEGKLFCSLKILGLKQQIEIFTDRNHFHMIASGSGDSSPIYLNPVLGSGVTCKVDWDGSYLDLPEITLICPLSSSSSKSYSSISFDESSKSYSTLSSSSKTSFRNSSSSSSSYSESSSSFLKSSYSSTSSSSLDSSSSTSRGLTSSSSLSFIKEWNKIKPLILANVAVAGAGINNRLAQSIKIVEQYYSIGNVYCYFYKANGLSTSYNINMGLYDCTDAGIPNNLIELRTISASLIEENNWYPFTFNMDGITPSNGYLSFVVWQEGGDENNYVLWGYDINNSFPYAKSWTTYNNYEWIEQLSTIRSLKITGNFDPFDFSDGEIITPPGEDKEVIDSLDNSDAIYSGTVLNSDGEVIINYPKLIASFIIDSSGSMGWNDRFNNRKDMVNKIITKIRDNYQENFLFDIIKFGAVELNANTITSGMGQDSTIKVDLTNPDVSPVIFKTSSVNADEGAIYTDDVGNEFVVTQTISNGNTLSCKSTSPLIGGKDIVPSGNLTLKSGSGDPVIQYTEVTKKTIANSPIVSYGFKNFENTHIYNLGDIKLDGLTSLDPLNLSRWQQFKPSSEISSLAMGGNGPRLGASLDTTASTHLLTRRVLGTYSLDYAKIVNSVEPGDTTVKVDNVSIFQSKDPKAIMTIDITDGVKANLSRTITSIDAINNIITFEPPAELTVSSFNNEGGLVHKSNVLFAQIINGTTLTVLLRDVNKTQNINLFLQTYDGYLLEWSVKPFTEWSTVNAYWLDETALLPLSMFAKDGTPFPNGSRIDVYVDKKPATTTVKTPVNVSKPAKKGSTRIYLP